jgi:hypothetical protein
MGAKTMQIHADFDPSQTLKGLSHEMDFGFLMTSVVISRPK